MNIVKKTKKVEFSELEPGDCFEWADDLFVKSNFEQDSIGLNDGYMLSGMCGEMVIPVDAEIHIVS